MTFLSYLLMATDRRFINSFFNNRIDQSSQFGPEILSAIKEATISIVIFSKNYASSMCCLNELVEIHKCFKELNQMVIPVFYEVDPSEVRKQTGKFGVSFTNTCEDKTDDEKQRWTQALTDVANIAGEDLSNWFSEAHMVEKIVEHIASMASGQEIDVFPCFSGADVRKKFLSHLRMALDRRSIILFDDNGINRSSQIGPELISAIREARISIVIFSKKYASSTWCLNELVEIHKCYMELEQMVIPVFYNVDPSKVIELDGEFGESFKKTCEGQTDDQKQRWKQALTDVANLAGEHLQNCLVAITYYYKETRKRT